MKGDLRTHCTNENVGPTSARSIKKTPENPSPAKLKKNADIRFVGYRVMHGCNVHHSDTVIVVEVEIGRTDTLNRNVARQVFQKHFDSAFRNLPILLDERPTLLDSVAKGDHPDVLKLLFEAIFRIELAHAAFIHRVDTLQFGRILLGERPDTFLLVWSTHGPRTSYNCAEIALTGFQEILASKARTPKGKVHATFSKQLARLKKEAAPHRLTSTVAVLRRSAVERGISCVYLGDSRLRLGEGRFQKDLRSSITDQTSYTAANLSTNKRLTNRRLRDLRLPVPQQKRVGSPDEAVEAASRIGFPVVVKPEKQHGGRGVTINVRTAKQLMTAVSLALDHSKNAIIEQFISGFSHRLTIIDGAFCAASLVTVSRVIGNGRSTIRQLIEAENKDSFRDGLRMDLILADKSVVAHLRKSRISLSTIPARGMEVTLCPVANVSRGSTPIDVTDKVHRDNIELAERAAAGIGLDVAGIDLIIEDISRSYREVPAAIIEVNARPGLCMHTWPRHGRSRDVGGALLDLVYRPGEATAITTAAIVGDKNTAIIARDIDDILRVGSRSVGLSIRRKAYVNGRELEPPFSGSGRLIRFLRREPTIDTLVWTATPKRVATNGLQLNSVDVVAILDDENTEPSEDYRCSLDIVSKRQCRKIVQFAHNQVARRRLGARDAADIHLVSLSGVMADVRDHLQSGGAATILEWHQNIRYISYFDGDAENSVFRIPFPSDAQPTAHPPVPGKRSHGSQFKIFAVAVALAMGVGADNLRSYLGARPRVVS